MDACCWDMFLWKREIHDFPESGPRSSCQKGPAQHLNALRQKNCLPTASRQFLTRNCPRPNSLLLKCLPDCLSPARREGYFVSLRIAPAVRVVVRQLSGKNRLAASRCLSGPSWVVKGKCSFGHERSSFHNSSSENLHIKLSTTGVSKKVIFQWIFGVSQTCLGANVLLGMIPSTVFKRNFGAFLGQSPQVTSRKACLRNAEKFSTQNTY